MRNASFPDTTTMGISLIASFQVYTSFVFLGIKDEQVLKRDKLFLSVMEVMINTHGLV